MNATMVQRLHNELDQFRQSGVYKRLNHIDSPQAPRVVMEGRGEVIILSSNNYLGLSNEPSVVQAGKDALDRFGTRLEKRFTRAQIERMMAEAGLEKIAFSDREPFWCAIGYKRI